MHAEIISIGSELTTGAKLDTNSQWLSLELSAVGIPVHFHVTVADNLDENVEAFRIAVERSDIVLITGGLGPTLDDLTRDAIARMTGTQLCLHEPSLEIIKGMFARRNRVMPERNVIQAKFPEGSEPIPNPRGTAPGIYMEIPRAGRGPCRLAAMPGVPSEMKAMFHESVLPRFDDPQNRSLVIRHARINCFGLGESQAEEMLGDVTARGRDPEVGITVHEATITLRIVAQGRSVEECQQKIASTSATIYERLGDSVFGVEDEELQHALVRLLKERRQTVSTAEVATGGLISHWLTQVAGHDTCFAGGVVTSTQNSLAALLNVVHRANSLAEAATAEVAGAMAAACRLKLKTDFAIAVTACSRQEDSEEHATPPVVFIAVAKGDGVEVRDLNLAGDPAILKSRTAKAAMNLLRLQLLR